MKIPGLVMARGGSKRIPRKNVKDFHGKPLMVWALEPLIESELVDDTFVVTDDEEIAEIGRMYGARIIHQPTEMCNYGHWGGPVTHLFWMQELEDMGYEFDYHVSNPSTCIWSNAQNIDGAIRLAMKYNVTVVEGCVEYAGAMFSGIHSRRDKGPGVEWLQRYDTSVISHIYLHTGGNSVLKKSIVRSMRQGMTDDKGRLLPEIFDGTADIDDPKYMAIEMTAPNTLPWVLPWYAQFDINTPLDWTIAEKIFAEVMLK